ncbi:MAG: ribosome small subunit-dependent GTPase A [Bacteroidia bacterium]
MKALVIKSTGSWYQVLTPEGDLWQARIRGKLRLQISDTSNPVAVGDSVIIEPDPHYPQTAQIKSVEERHNWIIRRANKSSARRQILACNLDAAVLVASLVAPRTSMGFIDRFLLICQAYKVPAIVFFNKMDLLGEAAAEFQAEINHIYRESEAQLIWGSATQDLGLHGLLDPIQGQRVLLAGHSGVGKSTLLNRLFPEAKARVGAISDHHEKGKHTTTFAELFPMSDGTEIIDTPGIRDFGVVDIPKKELAQYLPELRNRLSRCRFNDCQHINEPDCAVLGDLENETLPAERYHSYLSMLNEEDMFA